MGQGRLLGDSEGVGCVLIFVNRPGDLIPRRESIDINRHSPLLAKAKQVMIKLCLSNVRQGRISSHQSIQRAKQWHVLDTKRLTYHVPLLIILFWLCVFEVLADKQTGGTMEVLRDNFEELTTSKR